jgi:hypothetical protein
MLPSTIDARQHLRVEVRTAHDHHFLGAGVGCDPQRLVDAVHDDTAGGLKPRIACHHDIHPPRQGAADRFPGLAPHDQRLAHGQLLEMLKVGRQPPGQAVVATDDAVLGERRDQGHTHQTATGALICGCGA